MSERLQKRIAAAGLMSRRAAEERIAAGRVTVNGRVARLGEQVEETDEIRVDGRLLPRGDDKVYIMLNKPRGYVTTLHDEKGRRDVTELLDGLGTRVYPVGRLDMDSEGLLLLTNDGDFANALMHPSREVEKRYEVQVRGEVTEDTLEVLRQPMELDGYTIRPARVERLETLPDGARLAVTIHEGRNRQVRRMCERVGLSVARLRRVSEGSLRLGKLRTGCWRPLSEAELAALRREIWIE
ncbi:MAG: pseudouridine synthase [Eubacteriales bacterium]|nr:pseudouridine synthase [Eubacteriales bacterium]